MDKETKRTKEILRRLNNLERRIDKDWVAQNAINESATQAMTTLNQVLFKDHERIEQIWNVLEDQHDINQTLTNRLFMLDMQPAKGTH